MMFRTRIGAVLGALVLAFGPMAAAWRSPSQASFCFSAIPWRMPRATLWKAPASLAF